MKIIEKKLKTNILKSKKEDLDSYFINYTIEEENKKQAKNKYIQIPKYLYKMDLKQEFKNNLTLKFPFIITKNLQQKYNLFLNNKSRYIKPGFYKLGSNKFSDNHSILFNKIINITYSIKRICKIVFSKKEPLV